MLSLLSRVARLLPATTWIWLLAAALLLCSWGLDRYHIATLRDDLADAKQAAKAAEQDRDAWLNVAFQRTRELNLEREERAAGETATRELNNDLDTLDERYRPSIERIRQAPKSDDAPVAPVLRQSIEDLP